jgi:prevent-host-death family protein
MRHKILSVSKAKAKLLELTRKVDEEGEAYLLTKDGEPVSALVPVEDYEALSETLNILADHKTMKDLAAALDDEKRSRLWKRDKGGKWIRVKDRLRNPQSLRR